MLKRNFLGIFIFSVITVLMTACGGSSASFDAPTPNARYNGSWGGLCEYDAFFMEADLVTLTIDGTTATVDIETYPTSDCSGVPDYEAQIVYGIDFVGTQAPSSAVCSVDDLVNVSVNAISIDGVAFTQAEIDAAINDPDYDGFPAFALFCVDPAGTNLYGYDETSGDGDTEATRPTTIDPLDPISKI